ncbi:hypothetical protein [Pseudomonas donghuensis]|uniref:hypothetical protein n=1 Tax=Pseudomonas donghuensis TaxID=1163398 RepID=UPI000C29C429|nr:hypothetical protein COO64_18505 [Pseudomonas donghuensis]
MSFVKPQHDPLEHLPGWSAGVLLASAGTDRWGQVRTLVKSAEGHFSVGGQEGSDTDRNRARRLSGQVVLEDRFRPPARLADGRIGYPLSGRGAAGEYWQFYRDQAKQLFPRLTDAVDGQCRCAQAAQGKSRGTGQFARVFESMGAG